MRCKAPFLWTLLLFVLHSSYGQVPALNEWRLHLPWNETTVLQTNDQSVWCATPYGIFEYNATSGEYTQLTKQNRLSETGIETFQLIPSSNNLVVAYNNGLIDVLTENETTSLTSFRDLNTLSSKQIYEIFNTANTSYISTGLGILVIDLNKQEFKGNYSIGDNGGPVQVFSTVIYNNSIYAATSEGLKKAALNGVNLADYRNWSLDAGLPNNSSPVTKLSVVNNQLIALRKDSLFSFSSNWQFLYADGWAVTNMRTSNNQLFLIESLGSNARVAQLSTSGSLVNAIQNSLIQFPNDVLSLNNTIYIADRRKGMGLFANSGFSSLIPNGPIGKNTGQHFATNNGLWAASRSNWEPSSGNSNGLSLLTETGWTSFSSFNNSLPDSLGNVLVTITDETKDIVWAGSDQRGLLRKEGNTWSVYALNSLIGSSSISPQRYIVSGLGLDSKNNLWIANSQAGNPLKVVKPDGSSKSFSIPFPVSNNSLAQILVDDYDHIWICSGENQGIFVFNYGADINNTADDQWKWIRSVSQAGNLPSPAIRSITKDRNGFVWVGTTNGAAVFQCVNDLFASNKICDAIWPIVKQGNFAGYLLANEAVYSIATDGANRKWMGTNNGVFLVNEEGEETLQQFNKSNSLLLSDTVYSIAIAKATGEVFFGTSNGMASYRSTATDPTVEKGKVLVFPNPVPPDYTGLIGIKGLPENATVKITELNGRLIYETKALGGQATWNGRDLKGRNINSGVYLVIVKEPISAEKAVSKIVFIGK